MHGERLVAGLWCSTVLQELSAFLDGELSVDRRRELAAHVDQCDVCARMGAEVHATIVQLRTEMTTTTPLDDDAFDALLNSVVAPRSDP